MKVLMIGDIFGRPGRMAFRDLLPKLIAEHRVDAVIANAENAAGGRGLTANVAKEILESPVHVLTAGNHTLEDKTILPLLESHPLLRPLNLVGNIPGRGWWAWTLKGLCRIAVVSMQGQVFMEGKGGEVQSPFTAIDAVLPTIRQEADVVLIDFHAEATSEKRAFAWYVDGRVAAVVGTHTHVQTADEEILPGGTAYISDLGMTGPHASVVGLDKDIAIHRFLTGDKKKFEVARGGVRVEGVLIDVDERSGKARSIQRIKASWSGEVN